MVDIELISLMYKKLFCLKKKKQRKERKENQQYEN